MLHTVLVATVTKWLKSVYIYRSYRKIKTGVALFLEHSVYSIMMVYDMCDNILYIVCIMRYMFFSDGHVTKNTYS